MTPSRELVEAMKRTTQAYYDFGAMSVEHLRELRVLQNTPASDAEYREAARIADAEMSAWLNGDKKGETP